MVLPIPNELKCIHCGAKRFSVTTSRVPDDYYWRCMKCNHCGKSTWWGLPHIKISDNPRAFTQDTTRPHLVIAAGPKEDRATRRTSNLHLALPAGATYAQLLRKSTLLIEQRDLVSQYMHRINKKELNELTLAEKLELKRMLDELENRDAA